MLSREASRGRMRGQRFSLYEEPSIRRLCAAILRFGERRESINSHVDG
jgi:hypothetical protein